MRRFIIPFPLPATDEITLKGDLYHHLVTVLRLKPGQAVILANQGGERCAATILSINEGQVTLQIGQRGSSENIIPLQIVLYQGMPKGDKLELIIQKATELGVSRIIPFHADRSVVRIPDQRLAARLTRWQRIASEAARQSGAIVPEILPAASSTLAMAECNAELRLLPWEHEETTKMRQIIAISPPPMSVALMVGPEGGFSDSEVAAAASHGFQTISLGPRILRTETAGFSLVAILQQAWGDMG